MIYDTNNKWEACWAPHFSRLLNDWEMDMVECFLLSLQKRSMCREEEDKVIWTGSKNGKITVKALCSVLESRNSVLFPENVIRNSWVPPKLGFFASEATWAKVLTLDYLKSRGWSLENKYFLCQLEEEFTEHILIHCVKTKI